MKKQTYEKAVAEVTRFNNNDVITTSKGPGVFHQCECAETGGGWTEY